MRLALGSEARDKALGMRPFSLRRATGELRYKAKGHPTKSRVRPPYEIELVPRNRRARLQETAAVEPQKGRSRSTNRILVLPRGVHPTSSQARRYRDLVRSALADFEKPDQAAINIARSIALASLRLDQIQAQIFTDGEVDDERLVRLAGIVARSQHALAAMREKAAAPVSVTGVADLQRHLARLAQD
jgi:hypothetical protein